MATAPADWILAQRPPGGGGLLVAALPWPPSLNTYWRSPPGVGRVLLSEKGREYRVYTGQLLQAQRVAGVRLSGRLGVTVAVFPPDERTRDLDNLLKPLLDCLTHAATIEDDGLVDRLTIERGPKLRPWGLVTIALEQLEGLSGRDSTGAAHRGARS